MAFLGLFLSVAFVAAADVFTDLSVVFLAANFMAFGAVWIFKFVVLEKYLFGNTPLEVSP